MSQYYFDTFVNRIGTDAQLYAIVTNAKPIKEDKL